MEARTVSRRTRKPIARSRLRALDRPQLERLCVELAEDLRSLVWDENGDLVDTADQASEQGYQSLAMAMDPTHDYIGDIL